MSPSLSAYELFSPPTLPLYFLLLDTLSLTNSEALLPSHITYTYQNILWYLFLVFVPPFPHFHSVHVEKDCTEHILLFKSLPTSFIAPSLLTSLLNTNTRSYHHRHHNNLSHLLPPHPHSRTPNCRFINFEHTYLPTHTHTHSPTHGGMTSTMSQPQSLSHTNVADNRPTDRPDKRRYPDSTPSENGKFSQQLFILFFWVELGWGWGCFWTAKQ